MDKGKELDSHSQSDYCQQPSSFGKRCKGLYFTANHINQITVHKNNGHLSPQNIMQQWYDYLLSKKNKRATGVKSA